MRHEDGAHQQDLQTDEDAKIGAIKDMAAAAAGLSIAAWVAVLVGEVVLALV